MLMDYGNVSITWKRVAELDGKSVAVAIPRENIEAIRLCYGRQGERTWLQVVFAAALMVSGGVALLTVIQGTRASGVFFDWFSLVVLMLPIGGWMLRTALTPGYYLEVVTADDRRKIAFAADARREEIETFLEAASDELGVAISLGDLPRR